MISLAGRHIVAIVDDYAGIAAELRRIRAEKLPEKEKPAVAHSEPASQHRMRATITGELLYRRLIAKKASTCRNDLNPINFVGDKAALRIPPTPGI